MSSEPGAQQHLTLIGPPSSAPSRLIDLPVITLCSLLTLILVVCQVSDFGQAIRVRDAAKGIRSRPGSSQLPWRWLPPECLPDPTSEAHWSLYSDVWAFGVVLWEMVSGGQTPYHDLDLDEESYARGFDTSSPVVQLGRWLSQGNRLAVPCTCPAALASIIRSCWAACEC